MFAAPRSFNPRLGYVLPLQSVSIPRSCGKACWNQVTLATRTEIDEMPRANSFILVVFLSRVCLGGGELTCKALFRPHFYNMSRMQCDVLRDDFLEVWEPRTARQ